MSIRGKATMGTTTDVEPLLRGMLLDMKRREGLTADISADEVKAAAKAFGEDLDASSKDAADDVKETMERSLPKGVRIERIVTERDGTRVTSKTTFAFDDIKALPDLEVFFERGKQSQKPFASFKLKDDNGALVVDGAPPSFDVPESMPAGNALMLELELDAKVVDHNATRADGKRLIWEIDITRLKGSTIHARYAL